MEQNRPLNKYTLQMKKVAWIIILAMGTFTMSGQDISGQWNGLLKIHGTQLRVVFNISKTDKGFISTMDSPDQGAKGIPTSLTNYENDILRIELAAAGITYEGTLTKSNQLNGEFRQEDFSSPLLLTREIQEKEKFVRPQDPVKPYPYYSEEVKFVNSKANVTLSGTLTLPQKEGKFPVVVLITGSGPQNRDEEIAGHRPFLVLSDYLTRNGIAVLRYDDRGIAESTGNFSNGTTQDFEQDVDAAVRYLLTRKEIDKKKIGLIGHSEGGIIAPAVAAKSKDIRYIVLMAGCGMDGKDLLLLQAELIGKAMGQTEEQLDKNRRINKGVFDIVLNASDSATMRKDLTAYFFENMKNFPLDAKPAGVSDEVFIWQQMRELASPWFQYFLKYDPALVLRKVKCPVFALNGSKDLQVSPRENLSAIKSNIEQGGNNKITVREYPDLNHLFQNCTTGLPSEYEKIQQTISPQVLRDITDWILMQTK